MNQSNDSQGKRVLIPDEPELDLDDLDDYSDDFGGEEEEILQQLSLTLNDLSDSVSSLRRTNDLLAKAIFDLHVENEDLMQRQQGSSTLVSTAPTTAFQQPPTKRARRVSFSDDDELNVQAAQQLMFHDVEKPNLK